MSEPSSTAPLVPQGDQVFLDHVGLFVTDFDASPGRLRRLGFTLTPIARHTHGGEGGGAPAASGTGNQCATFREGYIEMVGPTGEETPLAGQLRDALARYPGLHLIAFSAGDAATRHAGLPAQGFQPLPLVRLRRPVATPEGEDIARFDVVRVAAAAMPEGRIQILTHHTPELVWQGRYLDHDNRAEALTGVLVGVDDPAEAAGRYGRFLERTVEVARDQAELCLDRGRVTFVTPSRLAAVLPGAAAPCTPFIAAVGLRTGDLAATRRRLAERAIDHESSGDECVRIGAGAALGATLVFHRPGVRPWR